MVFSSWRGVVGLVNPTMRPGSTEELIRLLPEGIGVLPLYLDVRRGAEDEFKTAMPAYEAKIAVLAEHGCDLIIAVGAPPFMVQGRKRETEIVRRWEAKFKRRILTVPQNCANALRAVKAKKVVGASYFPPALNKVFARYMRAAGFDMLAMEGVDVPFNKVQELSSQQVYAHIKKTFLAAGDADAIYILGSGWRISDIIDALEQDLQVPVVFPIGARVWEIQKRLHVRQPVRGFGWLLEALP
jgi:maleate cis-trans isomerase